VASAHDRVVVVGGGVGGLAAALAFGRAGHPVTLLEQDPLPATASAEEAFAAERRGAPQVHQTHGFLARVVVLLRERFPDVLDDLLAAGCTVMPAAADLGEPRPGDEDLAVLIVRRTTFEWVLRRAVLAEPGVEVRTGCTVDGLLTRSTSPSTGVPVVGGVRLDDGSIVEGDLVVAGTGRRGAVGRWLADLDVELPETIHQSGLVYLSRWYRLPPGFDVALDPKLGGDLGFVKFLAVPGDGGTLSVTLAVRSSDRELRAALADPDRFEHACRLLPGPDRFFAGEPLEPCGGVQPMGGLLNRLRHFLDEQGAPRVLGFHVIGDAHTCTNPLYGRGCALALVQATLLADATAAHRDDPAARARAYEQASAREVEPWYHASVQMDAMGADPAGLPSRQEDADPAHDGDVPPTPEARGVAALFVAAETDPVIARALARYWHLLSSPADLMTDAEAMGRMAAVLSRPDDYPLPPRRGPTRRALLAALAQLAA
jgi:2-polyprenyl-6-methoxyphenol hydroxylase-like FAD-dependent oxidoreductase